MFYHFCFSNMTKLWLISLLKFPVNIKQNVISALFLLPSYQELFLLWKPVDNWNGDRCRAEKWEYFASLFRYESCLLCWATSFMILVFVLDTHRVHKLYSIVLYLTIGTGQYFVMHGICCTWQCKFHNEAVQYLQPTTELNRCYQNHISN